MAKSHGNPNAYRAVGLKNSNNQVGGGNPELFKNGAVLDVSSAPQIALGVFNAASFVTGQYFMSQVNGKLAAITDGVDRIEHFLDAEQRSKLLTGVQ